MSAPLDSGQTKFLPAALPLLEDGEYQVKVQQTVHSPQSSELPGAGVSFWVKGPRFALNPKDVFSQHPSPGKVGAFGNELPHIVLSRKTLPWERSIDDQSPPAPPAVPTPWLALLVVDEHDPGAPTSTSDHWVSSGTVGDLLPENQGGYCPSTTFGPQLLNIGDGSPLDPWEKVSDACHYIDLPTALFSQIAPSLEELTLLSHVREVNTGHQAIDDIKADGSYAVVVSNRFPYSESYNPPPTGLGVKNTVCLVSLEGLQKNLPGGEAIPDTYTHVRVAVLSHWSFFDNGGDNVQAMLEKLDVGPLNRTGTWYPGSESPSPTPTPQNPAPFSSYVDCAFTMGYTALNHNTRVGERVVSWYRGPLRPFFTGSGANQRFLSSDAALEYSPDSGMFDVSHAAAWQLGQLLALQSKQFATALYNFRRNALAKYATQKSLARIHQTSKQVLRSGESETEGKILDDFTRWLGSGELVEVLTKTGEEGSGAVASVVDKVEAALETVEEAIDEVEEKFREPDPALEVRRALDATSGTTQATATA
ncbi:MAG: hypothetical protein JJ956_18255, partial [Pseudomonadales bacterium]|nr:hypothetical protein [Pseudomonadales bacterium]